MIGKSIVTIEYSRFYMRYEDRLCEKRRQEFDLRMLEYGLLNINDALAPFLFAEKEKKKKRKGEKYTSQGLSG